MAKVEEKEPEHEEYLIEANTGSLGDISSNSERSKVAGDPRETL